MDNQDLPNEIHRVVTTVVIYNSDRKYLVLKRAGFKKVHPNKWTVPGGGLHQNDYKDTPETYEGGGWYRILEKTLEREIKEEIGIKIGTPIYFINMAFIRPDRIPVLVLNYYAPYISGEVILDEENVEYKWASLEECKKLDLITGIYEEIEEVDKILSTMDHN